MKKLLLSLLTVLALGSNVSAQDTGIELTYDFTAQSNTFNFPSANQTTATTVTRDGVSFTFYNSWWQKNTSNSYVATKKKVEGAYFKFGPIEGKNITSITLYLPTDVTNKSKFDLFCGDSTTAEGQFTFSASASNSNTINIPVEAQKGTFTIKTANTSNQCGFGKIIMTYTTGEPVGVSVETPVITVSEDFNVSISCATEGASIYYTLNGEAPTAESTPYNGAFNLTESCTIKALAIKGDDQSKVASKAVVVPVIYKSLAELVAKAQKGDNVTVAANMSVLYQNGQNLYLTDGASNVLINVNKTTYNTGDKISGFTGTIDIFNTLFEVTNATLTAGGNGATYAAKEISDISALTVKDNLFDLVKVSGASIAAPTGSNARSYSITVNGTTVTLYNTFNLTLTAGDNFDVTAFVSVNTGTLQLLPIEVTAGTPAEVTLGAIKVNGEVVEDNAVISATEGDVITFSAANAEMISYTISSNAPDIIDAVKDSEISWIAVAGEYIVKIEAALGDDSATRVFKLNVVEKAVVTPDPVVPGTDKWVKVTSMSELTVGARYIIAKTDAGTNHTDMLAIATTANANNRKATSIKLSDDKSEILTPGNEVMTFVLEQDGKDYLWKTENYQAEKQGYLYGFTGTSTNNRLQCGNPQTDNLNRRNTSVSFDDNGNVVITFVNCVKGNANYVIYFNDNVDASGGNCFSSYSASNNLYLPIQLYKYVAEELAEIVLFDYEEPEIEGTTATVNYTLHVKNHKDGNVYKVKVALSDADGVNVPESEIVIDHSPYTEPAGAPRRVKDLAEGATHRLSGTATINGLIDGVEYTKMSYQHAVGEDANIEEAEKVEKTLTKAVTTSIEEVEAAESAVVEWYDLSGRRIAAPGKGVFIKKNGSKVSKYAF